MVTEKKVDSKTVFLCDICGLGYAEKKTAQECEDYCRSHAGSCSAEISKKAIYLPGAPILPETPQNDQTTRQRANHQAYRKSSK